MARINQVMLLGAINTPPKIAKIKDQYVYAMVYVTVVRGERVIGDKVKYMRSDNPMLMTWDPVMIREIESWEVNDIVDVKGVVATRPIKKSSYCPHCNTKNQYPGAIVYVNPIFCKKRCHMETDNECYQYLAMRREVSNQCYVFGTLCRVPTRRKTGGGTVYTQYQIALNRKFRIKADPEGLRSDYPWVKSYGENGEEDLKRLCVGSEVIIDGFLQTRNVNRHAVCGQALGDDDKPLFFPNGSPVMRTDEDGEFIGCGESYDWPDRALELVPYLHGTEYISGYYTDEDLIAKEKEERLKALSDAGLAADGFDDDSDAE